MAAPDGAGPRVGDGEEPRHLGFGSAVALVVGNMVGAGVFTTSGFALADLGSRGPVLAAWAAGGVLATCGALSYGALARRIPESGGEYTFLARIVHPLAGFLAGWVSLLAGFTAPIAAAALGLQAYLEGALGTAWRAPWAATAAVVTAGLMHGLRLRGGVWIQNGAVALKLGAIVAFLALAAGRLAGSGLPPPPPTRAPLPGPATFALTLVWISFAYSGWNAAVYVAGEVRAPERTLQRALVTATLGVTALYLALNAVFLYAAPVPELAGRADVGTAAAAALGGPALRAAVAGLVALALATSISAMVMAGPRVYARMARDGLFPARLGRPGGLGGLGGPGGGDLPAAAVWAQVILALIAVWTAGLVELLGYIGFTLGLSAAAAVGALVHLRRREGAKRVPVPGYPWVPVAFVAATLAISVGMAVREPGQAAVGLATLAAGAILYRVFRGGGRGAGARAHPPRDA